MRNRRIIAKTLVAWLCAMGYLLASGLVSCGADGGETDSGNVSINLRGCLPPERAVAYKMARVSASNADGIYDMDIAWTVNGAVIATDTYSGNRTEFAQKEVSREADVGSRLSVRITVSADGVPCYAGKSETITVGAGSNNLRIVMHTVDEDGDAQGENVPVVCAAPTITTEFKVTAVSNAGNSFVYDTYATLAAEAGADIYHNRADGGVISGEPVNGYTGALPLGKQAVTLKAQAKAAGKEDSDVASWDMCVVSFNLNGWEAQLTGGASGTVDFSSTIDGNLCTLKQLVVNGRCAAMPNLQLTQTSGAATVTASGWKVLGSSSAYDFSTPVTGTVALVPMN